MKNTITGDAAIIIRNNGRRYTTTETTTDPWWGERKTIRYWVEADGKTYEETTDRDGWIVLTEVEG